MYGIDNLSTGIGSLSFEMGILKLGLGWFNKTYWAGQLG